ncbi:MAG: lipopolysaccharide biosynthesis protein [Oscillospiraceae bacterium]|nr:lipopolysaccharide biosynthesis protein [Oscillospiraceae bacterium]
MSSTNITSNFAWRLMERFGAQTVTLIVGIKLQQLLGPEVFGTVALVTIFTAIMQVFVDSGLGNALIQKKDADDLDFSSVFFFNITVCSVLYVIMYFSAPLIAAFYEKPELTALVRVLSLTLLISGVKNVQQAYVSRNMLFKKFFFSTLGGTIGAAVLGLWMAYNGYGAWAIVAQSLFNAAVDTTILWFTVRWRPKKQFSLARLKILFSFGWKMLLSSLLETIYNELRQLIIGKIYSDADLAQYNEGKKVPNLIVTNINTSIDSVLLPAMSREQDNAAAVKNMTRRSIKISTYIMMPLMAGLAVCAEPLVRLVLKEKWLPCVPYLQIFCISFAFHPIHTANLNAIKAMGRSDLFLILEIIKKVVGITAILISMWISVWAMAVSALITSLLSQVINAWPNRKLLNYSYLEQVKDMLPQIFLSLFMGAAVYCVKFIGLHDLITLPIQFVLGVLIYAVFSKLFHIDSFEYLLTQIKSILSKRKKETVK